MGKKTALLALWCSFLCIIYFGLYRGLVYPVFGTDGGEAFIAFCGLALFLGQNGNAKNLLNYTCSAVCGGIWGWIFLLGVGILLPVFNMSFVPAAVVDIFVFTTLAIIVHTFLLRDTIVNNMPFVFMGVATTFSGTVAPGLMGVVQISLLLFCGILIGTATNEMAPKIFGPPPAE
ncbi:MAG: DUF1097 domain-containing protein [Gracilibacteraceae bacterium]|jgi:hypothetical protein|nr:DUF1097 domain-containing protein [Gracilibacteraceae bacterium]